MPATSPLSAARFSISIDGVEVGRFATLVFGAEGTSPARNVQPHELAHVVQQSHASGHKPGVHKWPDIELKSGSLSQAALLGLRVPGGRRVTILALATGARLTLLGARVERSSGQAKGGDIAMEEIVLAHEGFG